MSLCFLFIGAVAPKQIESSTVRVHQHELQLSIDHFSWRIVTFIRSLFTSHISIGCYPLLPRCMPKSRKVVFHVHVYKAQRGMREVMNATFLLSFCDDSCNHENNFLVYHCSVISRLKVHFNWCKLEKECWIQTVELVWKFTRIKLYFWQFVFKPFANGISTIAYLGKKKHGYLKSYRNDHKYYFCTFQQL